MKQHPVFFFLLFLSLLILPLSQGRSEESPTVTDMAGREVLLRYHTERIVTAFKPAALSVLSLGLSNHLVGVDSHSKKDRLQQSVYPEIRHLPGVGSKSTGLNLETIIQLNPDLVLLYSQKDGIKIADRLVNHGIPAIIIVPETFKGMEDTLWLIAKAVGKPSLAEKTIGEINGLMHRVDKSVSDIPENERSVVYYASSLGIFSTATRSLLQDDMICRAGGANASHELQGYFREISPEQLIQWNPDLMVTSRAGKANASKILERAEFQQVSAVTSGRCYVFPSNLAPWDFPSPLSAVGVYWLAHRLYPDRFRDSDLMTEIDRFHQNLFGKTFTAMGGEMDDLLLIGK